MQRCAVLGLAMLLATWTAGCIGDIENGQGAGDAGSTPLADADPLAPDADPDAPDAREGEGAADANPGAPDANRGVPDASPGAPDASPETPDASPGAPDASPETPDASPETPDANLGPGEPVALAGITELHNQVRAEVGVGPLVWDPDLAAVAQAWAEQCVDDDYPAGLIDHNAGRSDSYPGYVGENVYGSGGTAAPQNAVGLWAAEKAYYDYETNSCAPGEICGHYTQIVWAASERLGCGISYCPGLTYSSSIVCNYSPGGNTGGKPY